MEVACERDWTEMKQVHCHTRKIANFFLPVLFKHKRESSDASISQEKGKVKKSIHATFSALMLLLVVDFCKDNNNVTPHKKQRFTKLN